MQYAAQFRGGDSDETLHEKIMAAGGRSSTCRSSRRAGQVTHEGDHTVSRRVLHAADRAGPGFAIRGRSRSTSTCSRLGAPATCRASSSAVRGVAAARAVLRQPIVSAVTRVGVGRVGQAAGVDLDVEPRAARAGAQQRDATPTSLDRGAMAVRGDPDRLLERRGRERARRRAAPRWRRASPA